MRALIKGIVALLIVLIFVVFTVAGLIFLRIWRRPTLLYLNFVVSCCCWLMVKNLGITVSVKNKQRLPELFESGQLIVANHLSYLDIFILSSVVPSCFITSNDMKATPVLGQICQMAGCLFVERKNPNIRLRQKSAEELTKALAQRISVTLFPEATSSNAEQVLPFKRSYFYPAHQLGRHCFCLTFNYTKIAGEPISLANRDVVCWYGDMTFFPHFWQFLHCPSVEVELTLLGQVPTHDFEQVGDLADHCREMISAHFHRIG